MIEALSFLIQLKKSAPPFIVHLVGEDGWISRTVRRRLISAWGGDGQDAAIERLVGTAGIDEIPIAKAAGSLFADTRVIWLTDPLPGERGTALSSAGKRQLVRLEASLSSRPEDLHRFLLETPSLKKTSALAKMLSKHAAQVDVSTPKGKSRRKWIQLLIKKEDFKPSRDLLEALVGSEVPLGVLAADLEKIALATGPEEEATLSSWRELSQADPESTVWEIGDSLGKNRPDQAMQSLRNLRRSGATVHDVLPALQSWSQQRLQLKDFNSRKKGEGSPAGMAPFVVKKLETQVRSKKLSELRNDAMWLYRLDRCSKLSEENPEILLEKLLIQISEGRGSG